MQIEELLKLMVDMGASDLILRVGIPPMYRVDGVLLPQPDSAPLNQEALQVTFEAIATPEQRNTFSKDLELDFAYGVPGVARFRVNVMRQRGTLGFTFRVVPFRIPTVEELKLPQICKELILRPRGLVLVTGPTGSGKSTTVAAMIDFLNETESKNVITIEDPFCSRGHDMGPRGG